MSTFYGLLQRRGQSIDPALLTQLDEGLGYWKPDNQKMWCDRHVALSHAMLWNTPESKFEHLPVVHKNGVITCDIRLDNREELQEELTVHKVDRSTVTDSDLILAAYAHWGQECPQYLLGDFAFVIWDSIKQELFCVRDHLGIKPFYFHVTDDLFFCGNDLKAMAKHPEISTRLDDEAVANYMVNALLLHKTKTLMQGVLKLPAGHCLTVTSSMFDMDCYWHPQDVPKVKLANAKAYADKLRRLLEQSVYARMRSDYPITSHLSGGIDSSTIAILAARKLKEKGETLLAFNWLHEPGEGDDPDHYEFAHSRDIAEVEGIDHSYVYINEDDIYEKMMNHNVVHGDSAGFWYEYFVRSASRKKGSRTILSGWGGDELSTYHGQSYFSDLFISGQWRLLFHEVMQRARKRKQILRAILSILYQGVFLPLVPRRLYRFMPRNRNNPEHSPSFVKQEFTDILQKEKDKESVLGMQPQPRIRTHMEAYLQHGHLQARLESWAASAVVNRLEYMYPLLDKRVVEFILGVPAEYFMHDGVGRYLFRVAAKGLLVEEILWANTKREEQRIERLLQMSHSTFRTVVSELRVKNKKDSRYGNLDVLQNQLARSLKYHEFYDMCLLSEAGTLLTIMLSEKQEDEKF
jgi:asparagine synthase (glutamine-hydrolysing)